MWNDRGTAYNRRQPKIAALSARVCASNEPASESPTVDALTVPGAATSGEWRDPLSAIFAESTFVEAAL